jgi:integrase
MSRIRRVHYPPGAPYEVIFLDQHERIVVPLTEWYRLRKELGSLGTRTTYLTCLLPYLSFLAEQACPWNAPPEQVRPTLIAFHRDRLGCQVQPKKDQARIEVVPTKQTPVCVSTLRVMRAALHDFYLVLIDAGLYPFPNPLTSEILVALKREHTRALANAGAPDHAGIREETREQSRRLPSAFIRFQHEHAWKPEVRNELADVREGIHRVLNALIDDQAFPLREKVVLELLRTTGARLHEVVLMTVGGYQNTGIAGQARVINKGSYGCEVKSISFLHNPRVISLLTAYVEQVRPLHDRHHLTKLTDVLPTEPLFLTERGTPYAVKSFYYHWYRRYPQFQHLCPVRFSPHDLRHLFVSEMLIQLKVACGAGTGRFDSEEYLREREAFGSLVMAWRSPQTIDIYDQTRSGEKILHVLASYQQHLAQRPSLSAGPPALDTTPQECSTILTGGSQHSVSSQEREILQDSATIWVHDAETLAWINKLHQQKSTSV